ncbi:hypothetical protein CesoFtcFv8_026261 [Champsocephalus esox]|uniref:Uncharacterized protein n=1 Tax=Champsocephalus esox TaxID=159716 RepID=A0AAN8GCZ5_9TELE|nr:hypothetical protein CesoFtcFv8_026261 [Champsocephalus esox]
MRRDPFMVEGCCGKGSRNALQELYNPTQVGGLHLTVLTFISSGLHSAPLQLSDAEALTPAGMCWERPVNTSIVFLSF